jgi:hypothetical protein
MNFIPDRARAMSEMRRVARAGGVVAGYVWDFVSERSPSWPLRIGLRQINVDVPAVPGIATSKLDALNAMFQQAGLAEIATATIEVAVAFPSFGAFWQSQTPDCIPITGTIAALSAADRSRLIEIVRAKLPFRADGSIEYLACANAIKSRVPGQIAEFIN